MTGRAQILERIAQQEGRLPHPVEGGAGHGVQIEVQIVGAVDVVAARIPLVQVDAAEVDHPQERRQILHDGKVDHTARGVLDGARVDPARARRRRPLHEEEGAGRPVGIPLHHHGAIPEMGKQDRGNLDVVLQQITLGQPQSRPERLEEIGQGDRPIRQRHLDHVHAERDDAILCRRPERRLPVRHGRGATGHAARPSARPPGQPRYG